MKETNYFLTEAMGECCPKFYETYGYHKYIDFLTWEGFGKLWEWAEMELWWCRFLDSLEGPLSHYVNPENFAKAVAGYLQKK